MQTSFSRNSPSKDILLIISIPKEVLNPEYLENLQSKYQNELNRLAKAQRDEFKGEAILSLDVLAENQKILQSYLFSLNRKE